MVANQPDFFVKVWPFLGLFWL